MKGIEEANGNEGRRDGHEFTYDNMFVGRDVCGRGVERAGLTWDEVRRGVMNGQIVLVEAAQYEKLVRNSRAEGIRGQETPRDNGLENVRRV